MWDTIQGDNVRAEHFTPTDTISARTHVTDIESSIVAAGMVSALMW